MAQIGERLPGCSVEELGRDGDYGEFRIDRGESTDSSAEEAIADLVVKNGWALAELTREASHLEDVFRQLTMPPGGAKGGGHA